MRLHTLFPGACMFVKGSSFIKDAIISTTLTRVIGFYQFQGKLRAEVQLVSFIELSPSDIAFVVYQEKIGIICLQFTLPWFKCRCHSSKWFDLIKNQNSKWFSLIKS